MKQSLFPRFSFFSSIASGLLCLLFLLNVKVNGQELPSAPKEIIQKSIDNWNSIYGANVKVVGWSYSGIIKTEQQRRATATEISNTSKAWMPTGDFTNPSSVSAEKVSEVLSIPKEDIIAWQNKISGMIKSGNHIVKVNWKKGLTSFSTLCIADENTIIYDNMFYNIATIDHHSKCFDYRIGWIWQTKYENMTRGKIWANLDVKCDASGKVIECIKDCGGDMTAGEADCVCTSRIVGNCCVMDYNWAWACGFKKLKINFDAKGVKIGIDVEGYLGSSGKGNGSCIECCPEPPVILKPIATPKTTGTAGIGGPQKVATISVKTLSGEVVDVKVPNIIRPGDHITGSVFTNTLQGAVVDIDNKKTNVKDKLFSFIVPAGIASLPFLLKDNSGAELARTNIPVNVPNTPTPGNNVMVSPDQIPMPPRHSPGNFAPMNYCQTGQPLTINGFFDGDASNTHVSINNIPCEMIAESSTGCFIQVPDNMPGGRQTLTINEQDVTESIPVQVVTTNLSTNKTVVQKNTRAKVTLSVNNLENIDLNNNNFKVELTNGSPNVIQFRNAGSNTLSWNLTTENVRNGTFTTTVDVQGIAVGSYTVTSNLSSTTCTECWKQYEDCIAAVAADEKKCYDACDKAKAGTACYLACSTAARAQEIECFAQYLACMRKKFGF